jgi:serine O-acetyltransferase
MTEATRARTGREREASLRENVAADLAAVARIKGHQRLNVLRVVDALALPGSCAVLMFRIAVAFHRRGLKPVSRALYFLNVVLFGAALHPAARVGPGLVVAHPVGMGWGEFFTCGRNATMTAGVRFGTAASSDPARNGHPTLGDDVVMLDGAKAMGSVTIGDRAIVGANTLVLADVPPEAIMVGQPARIAKMRSDRQIRTDPPVDRSADPLADARAEVGRAAPAQWAHGSAG